MEVPGKTIDIDVGESDFKLVHACEPCQCDNITTQASGFCKDCGEFMCDVCFKHHLKGKLCRHHVLVDVQLSSLPSAGHEEDIVKCSEHKGDTVRFYCREHEVVGCGDCMIPDHGKCALESIKNLSKNFQQSEEFETFVSKVGKLTHEHKENEKTVKENKRINKTMLEKVLGDIKQFRTDVNNHLDKMESDIISEAKQIISDNDEVLTKLDQDCRVLSSKVEEIKSILNTEIYQDNVLFINTIECKPRLSSIEQADTKIKSKNMKRIEFVCDEQLHSFITSAKKLGTLIMPTTAPRRQSSQMTETKTEKTMKTETETAVKDMSQENKVCVGTRVRFNKNRKFKGTFTAVNPDGTVDVQFDNGKTVVSQNLWNFTLI